MSRDSVSPYAGFFNCQFGAMSMDNMRRKSAIKDAPLYIAVTFEPIMEFF